MNIVNLTPHSITLCGIEYDGAGNNSARMEQEEELIEDIDNIPVYKMNFTKTINLPEPKKDTIFIVSKIVAENNLGREDLYVTCKPVRDKKGKIIGCKALSKINYDTILEDIIKACEN